MKQRWKNVLTSTIICAILMNGVAFAWTGTKELRAHYADIKIVIDGQILTPKDVNGTVVEPFLVGGTTYVPVRAISEAYGKNVEWDGDVKTVTITTPKPPVNTSVVRIERVWNYTATGILSTTYYYALLYLKSNCIDFIRDHYVWGNPIVPVDEANTVTTEKVKSKDIVAKDMSEINAFLEKIKNNPTDYAPDNHPGMNNFEDQFGHHYFIEYLGESYFVNIEADIAFLDAFFQ